MKWKVEHLKACDEVGVEYCNLILNLETETWRPAKVVHETDGQHVTFPQKLYKDYAPEYQERKKEMPVLELEKIKKVPISMIVGAEDKACTHAVAQQTAEKIGDSVVDFTTINGFGHYYFGYANFPWFVDIVISQL